MPGAFSGKNTALEVGWDTSPLKGYITAAVCHRNLLRRIPLNVRAISAKNIYQKTTHSTVTF